MPVPTVAAAAATAAAADNGDDDEPVATALATEAVPVGGEAAAGMAAAPGKADVEGGTPAVLREMVAAVVTIGAAAAPPGATRRPSVSPTDGLATAVGGRAAALSVGTPA